MSTCKIVSSKRFNPRARHIALRYHSTGDLQQAKVIAVKYLPSEYMPSDALTKALPFTPLVRQRSVLMGLQKLSWDARVHEKLGTTDAL